MRKGTYDVKNVKTYQITYNPEIHFLDRRSLFSDRVIYLHLTILVELKHALWCAVLEVEQGQQR